MCLLGAELSEVVAEVDDSRVVDLDLLLDLDARGPKFAITARNNFFKGN